LLSVPSEAIQLPSPILLRAAFSIAAPASSIPAHQRDDQFAEIAATLTKAAPDVVLYVSNAATRDAQELAHAFPIVALFPS
jgi:hypothetical protein